jgi:L-serine dehydratase
MKMGVNIFDIIGPVMIGPSSSHTAGAVRMGRVAWKILGEDAARANITLVGSFAATYKGHGTDKALIAGILGMRPEDERIRESLEIARGRGLEYTFSTDNIAGAHPNTAVLCLTGIHGAECTVEGVSIGGGQIQITRLNGVPSAFAGQTDTLIVAHHDTPGALASVTSLLASHGVNIGSFHLSRPRRRELAIMTIEMDSSIKKDIVQELRALENIVSVTYMQPAH